MRAATEGDTPSTVLVTGASTGIGRAVALELARRGFQVFAGVRRPEAANRLQEDGRALSGNGSILPIEFDVTDEAAIASAARAIEERVGDAGLHGLVNNAGVVVAGPLEFLPLADLRNQLEVNVIGQVAVTQAMLPLLRKARRAQPRPVDAGNDPLPFDAERSNPASRTGLNAAAVPPGGAVARMANGLYRGAPGRIVFVGSISGLVSSRLLGAYAASKFAIEAVGDAFRLELAPWDLQVAIVEPGRVRTPIWDKSLDAGEARMARMPDGARELYGGTARAVSEGISDVAAAGIAPDGVARAVVHALTAARARTRYRVGVDARVAGWLRKVLPDRLMDRFLLIVRR